MFFKSKNKLSDLPDAELVERYRHSHDPKYVGHLYLKYTHLILGLCLKYFKDEDKANDAVMSIFEQIVKDLKKHNVDNFKSWLYTLSKNYCLQELRKNKSIHKKKDAFEIFLANSVENDLEFHQLEKETKEKLLTKLELKLPLLKDNQEKCVRAFYLESKTYQQIADENNLSLKEVKSSIQNGKRNLKIKMTEV